MQKIGIIGPNAVRCSAQLYDFGVELGKRIARKDRVIVSGGRSGFPEAVCKGVKLSNGTYPGQTIGILPGETDEKANPFVDVAIPTGISIARNVIIVRTADILISAGGGAGTLSEIAYAWELNKRVLCITLFDGWAKELAGKNIDERAHGLLVPVNSIEEILKHLE